MNVYIDESGDLGWKFDKPNRHGGSSRYLTIASIICPPEKSHLLKRIVIGIKKLCNIPKSVELKGNKCHNSQAILISKRIVKILKDEPNIKIVVITVKKKRVSSDLRVIPNILYNYMLNISLTPIIKDFNSISIIHDKRSIKVTGHLNLEKYFKDVLWKKYSKKPNLKYSPTDSSKSVNIQLIDWVTNFVWRYYEDQEKEPYDELRGNIIEHRLFF